MLGVLAALAVAVDFIAGAFGVKRFGASGRAVTGATIGAIVGLFFGIVGVLVGPFVGAVIGELSVRRNLAAAGRAGVGAALGLALGTAAKLAIAFAMIGVSSSCASSRRPASAAHAGLESPETPAPPRGHR